MPDTDTTKHPSLRILQLASHSEITRGGAVQMARLATGLGHLDHKVVCAFNRPDASVTGPEFDELRNVGIEVAGFEFDRKGEKYRFRRWCRERDFQVVHVHRDAALVFAWKALLGLKYPVIVAGRGTVYPLKRFSWQRHCFKSSKTRRVIAVAEAVKESLIQYGVPGERIDVVYGGVDENEFRPGLDGSGLGSGWGVAEGSPLVGNVAALVGKKGHDLFFQAAARVLEQVPECRFVCVGKGKPEQFKTLLSSLGISDAVLFAGHQTDMPRVMAALDIVVSSATQGEGLTGAVREAMSCGRVVVTTNAGGNREIVTDQVNGRLVPMRDPVAMADAMLDLLSDPERAASLGEAARDTILRRFTNSIRCERIERIYRSIINR
jgi:glycosyltransferase involved in cell wall biosynthesis